MAAALGPDDKIAGRAFAFLIDQGAFEDERLLQILVYMRRNACARLELRQDGQHVSDRIVVDHLHPVAGRGFDPRNRLRLDKARCECPERGGFDHDVLPIWRCGSSSRQAYELPSTRSMGGPQYGLSSSAGVNLWIKAPKASRAQSARAQAAARIRAQSLTADERERARRNPNGIPAAEAAVQRPYFAIAATLKMNAVATANSEAMNQRLRRLIPQLPMSSHPNAARATRPTQLNPWRFRTPQRLAARDPVPRGSINLPGGRVNPDFA